MAGTLYMFYIGGKNEGKEKNTLKTKKVDEAAVTDSNKWIVSAAC